MFGQLRSEHAKEFLLIAWSSAFKPLIQKSSHNVLDTGCIIVLQVPHVHITSAAQRCDEVFTSVVLFVVLFGTTGQFHMIIWYIIICSHDNMVQLDFRNYKWVCPKIWYVSENPVVLSCFVIIFPSKVAISLGVRHVKHGGSQSTETITISELWGITAPSGSNLAIRSLIPGHWNLSDGCNMM